jgi:hypothetical protein
MLVRVSMARVVILAKGQAALQVAQAAHQVALAAYTAQADQ